MSTSRTVRMLPHAANRQASIDILRGVVMLLMLLDHVRETFLLHLQVGDPLDVDAVAPGLAASRLLAHLCAPVFVALTGLSAWLYGQRQRDPRRAASAFLLKRGLFLVVLELTLVNFGWTPVLPPTVVYLQVIWAIGVSMITLAGLLWLPRPLLVAVGVGLVAGHNLLDGVQAVPQTPAGTLWMILHERGWFEIAGIRFRTSYPVLPWFGVIALGYAIGPWFASTDSATRRQRLWWTGALMLLGFAALRVLNVYGDAPWRVHESVGTTLLAFFNVTKYPPSLLFLLLTLGIGAWLLRAFERPRVASALAPLATFGAAPMFFYLLHIYALRLLYLAALSLWGANQGALFGIDSVAGLWAITAAVALLLWAPTRAFARLKARRRDVAWLRYF